MRQAAAVLAAYCSLPPGSTTLAVLATLQVLQRRRKSVHVLPRLAKVLQGAAFVAAWIFEQAANAKAARWGGKAYVSKIWFGGFYKP